VSPKTDAAHFRGIGERRNLEPEMNIQFSHRSKPVSHNRPSIRLHGRTGKKAMIQSRIILVAAAALLALAAFESGNEAMAGVRSGNAAYCQWYKQQAMKTGDEYWWNRWRRCMRGDFWD
jgi:hypothetical protein